MAGQAALFKINVPVALGSLTLNGQTIIFAAPFTGTPITLHADVSDLQLRATDIVRERATYFSYATLVDESGNILVDEAGNELIAASSILRTYVLHALADDFILHAEKS